MFVLSNFISALAGVISIAINVLWWLVIIRALLSWVNPDPFNPIVQMINTVTEPVLAPFRRLIPSWRIGLDLSPIFAILFLYFLQLFVVRSLNDLSMMVR